MVSGRAILISTNFSFSFFKIPKKNKHWLSEGEPLHVLNSFEVSDENSERQLWKFFVKKSIFTV